LQHFAAAALRRLNCREGLDGEAFLGIKVVIGWSQTKAAARQDA
jgi:hypothetical protein